MSDSLHEKGKALEDIFFAERDRQLIQALKDKAAKEKAAVDLGAVTGIQNHEVLARVAGLGVTPETATAFAIVPLLFVAWADEVLDESERQAILTEAAGLGLTPGSAGFDLLSGWLSRSPNTGLIEAWQAYHQALAPHMTTEERAHLKDDLMEKARHIARSSGGFLGIGSVSGAERAALEKLEQLLS